MRRALRLKRTVIGIKNKTKQNDRTPRSTAVFVQSKRQWIAQWLEGIQAKSGYPQRDQLWEGTPTESDARMPSLLLWGLSGLGCILGTTSTSTRVARTALRGEKSWTGTSKTYKLVSQHEESDRHTTPSREHESQR